MNSRIKEIRTILDISQEEFGRRLGVSRDVIVNAELGRAELKPLFIEHLCSVYHVNEDWLKTGVGERFEKPETNILTELKAKYQLTELDMALIEGYLELSKEDRKVVKKYSDAVCAKMKQQKTIS